MMRRASARPLLVSWEDSSYDHDHSTAAAPPQGGCISSSDESSYEYNDDDDDNNNNYDCLVPTTDTSDAPFLPLATAAIILKRKRLPPMGQERTEKDDPERGVAPAVDVLRGTDVTSDNDYYDGTTNVDDAPSSSSSPVSPWMWLPDDAAAHMCSYLDLTEVRHFSQAQSRLRREALLRNDHVWKEQAQQLWHHLPHLERWNMECFRTDDHGDGPPTFPWRSPAQWLALATPQKTLPTAADASIFAPSRWSYSTTRTLRSRTVVRHAVRGSLQKEFEVVATAAAAGTPPSLPAVRFLGPIGHGDRSIRANAPLPRPTKILQHDPDLSPLSSRRFWRSPPSFLRRLRSGSTGSASSAEVNSTTEAPPHHHHRHDPPPQPVKWQPFVAPLRLHNNEQTGCEDVWDVTPRLVSYFEVEILSPAATTANAPGSHFRSSTAASSSAYVRHTHAKECVAVGLATDDFALHSRMPGWDHHSWGFHGDDAGLFHGAGTSVVRDAYGPTYGRGDVVGCGVDWVHEHIFFTLNGVNLGPAFDLCHDRLAGDVGGGGAASASVALEPGTALYPVVGIDTHDVVRMNLTGPFVYDVHQRCREQWPAVRAALQHKHDMTAAAVALATPH